jgi:predicted RND superfamily exporter protein
VPSTVQPTRAPFPVRAPRGVLLAAATLALGASLLASRLSVKADPAELLPPGATSVSDLENVKHRAQAFGNLLVGIEAGDPAAREAAGRELVSRLRTLDPTLVAGVVADDGSLRRHLWNYRYQYVPVADLEQVRDQLKHSVVRANPLFVDLSDEGDQATGGAGEHDRLSALRARLDDTEARAHAPTPLVSKDQHVQMFIVRATFPSTDVSKSRRLNDLVQSTIAATLATAPAGVRIGMTGDIATAIVEQDAIVRGMALATAITTVIVALALLLYYRSPPALAVIFMALGSGTIATLGFARLAVGFLNSASAFLISIVIGNGINFPMLVVARYLEERRRGLTNEDAIARAFRGTRRGTVTAALTAFVAYGSLMATNFRGFRDFGIIGAVGMLLCWVAAYTVAPAALAILGRRGSFDRRTPEPAVGRWLAALLPSHPGRVIASLALVAPLLIVTAVRYLASDPFEYNLRHLRASGAAAESAHHWQTKLDEAFGRGISGGFVVALDHREDAPSVADKLRGVTGATAAHPSGLLLDHVSSLDDLVPSDQQRRFQLLAEIRHLIDRNADRMPGQTAAEAHRLRPPDGLRPLGDADIPADLALQFTERDGHRGRLIFANTAPGVNGWDGRDLTAVSQDVRALALPPGTHVAGSAFVFADMIEAIRQDGPKVTLVAFLGVLLVIGLTMRMGRYGIITAVSATLGTTAMLTLASIIGLKINFLDFVALPLTMGIGTDYAANVLSRAREEARGGAHLAVLTTGGVVLLCSFTTIIGYASLLVAQNAGIRSFGLAAMLGELTCISAGVWVGPALLDAIERLTSASAGRVSMARVANTERTAHETQ